MILEIEPRYVDAINTVAAIVHQNALVKGFHPPHQSDNQFIDSQTNNLHDEVSELHEAWREGRFLHPCDKAAKMYGMELRALSCAEEEYADIVIRVLDQCERLGINIGKAIAVKHQYNLSRPERHGGKLS